MFRIKLLSFLRGIFRAEVGLFELSSIVEFTQGLTLEYGRKFFQVKDGAPGCQGQ